MQRGFGAFCTTREDSGMFQGAIKRRRISTDGDSRCSIRLDKCSHRSAGRFNWTAALVIRILIPEQVRSFILVSLEPFNFNSGNCQLSNNLAQFVIRLEILKEIGRIPGCTKHMDFSHVDIYAGILWLPVVLSPSSAHLKAE